MKGNPSNSTAGNGELSWFPATGLSSDDIPNPVAEPNSTITYTLTDVTLCGTESTDVTVEVVDMQTEINGDTQICLGDGAPLAVTSPQSEADRLGLRLATHQLALRPGRPGPGGLPHRSRPPPTPSRSPRRKGASGSMT